MRVSGRHMFYCWGLDYFVLWRRSSDYSIVRKNNFPLMYLFQGCGESKKDLMKM